MGTSTQILRRAAMIKESAFGSYLAPNTEIPFNTLTLKQGFGQIEDDSIVGNAWQGLPVQGVRTVEGNLGAFFDITTTEIIWEVAFGTLAAGVLTMPTTKNELGMSLVALDEVKTNKYSGVVVPSLEITSAAEGDVRYTADLIGYVAETRDDTAFPAMSNSPGTRLTHQMAGGTNGYLRIGDQGNALAAGDNVELENISVTIGWNQANQFANQVGTLIPLSGAGGRPACEMTMTVSRHDSDNWHTWRDGQTALQAAFRWYSGAAAILLIEVPNFIISELTPSEDDITKLEATCIIARNGIGASYDNTNMAFNSPVRASITNS